MSPYVLAMAVEDSSNSVIVKTPNTETPPQPQPQPIINGSSISFSAAGAAKRRHHAPPVVVLYKECLKNHAAGIGGLALDGCGEFMPSAAASAADPASLKCAACGCHRNFHRRELDDPSAAAAAAHFISFRRLPPPLNLSLTPSPTASPGRSPPHAAAAPLSSAPHALLALGSGFSGQNRRNRENPVGKKRFRSKFSHTQKQKMQSFAEKLGWKLHKTHESLVEEFCNEIGVSRGVLKVWMHNNKHRDHNQIGNNNGINKSNGNGNGNGMNHDDDGDEQNGNGSGNNSRGSFDTTDNENQNNEGNSAHLLHVSTNGSSSSS